MRCSALGMIEVYGMLGAIEAADAALKAASVSLLRAKRVRGGLVTVLVAGDVAAVRSAVDAAVASLDRLGRPCSSHVIPRLSPEVASMLAEDEETCAARAERTSVQISSGPLPNGESECPSPSGESAEPPEDFDEAECDSAGDDGEEVPDLENLTVMELRKLARNVELRTMSKKQIRFAGKAELIRELTAFFNETRGESQ